MPQYRLVITALLCMNLSSFEIKISFEDPIRYESQLKFIEDLKNIDSRSSIKKLISSQDWIESHSLQFRPFTKKLNLHIHSKEPIFTLNKKYYVDSELNTFKYSGNDKSLIEVNGEIFQLEDVVVLIKYIKKLNTDNFNHINSINYSHVSGWLIDLNKTQVRLGKNLNEEKLKLFKETLDYLNNNNKIPSMIDLRYKDGVALKNG